MSDLPQKVRPPISGPQDHEGEPWKDSGDMSLPLATEHTVASNLHRMAVEGQDLSADDHKYLSDYHNRQYNKKTNNQYDGMEGD